MSHIIELEHAQANLSEARGFIMRLAPSPERERALQSLDRSIGYVAKARAIPVVERRTRFVDGEGWFTFMNAHVWPATAAEIAKARPLAVYGTILPVAA